MTADPEITIRRAETVGDYLACQSAQRRAWGIGDDSYVIPVATMVGAQHHGGLVLGAFLPNGEAAGVSFAFLGRLDDGRICLYSQLTGIVPAYQSRGLGYQMKMAQREIARAEGVSCIAWAFDPLQAGNAHFNLQKLGATASRFIENMYGPRSDALNQNTPTDRLVVVWPTDDRPRPHFDPETLRTAPRLIAVERDHTGARNPVAVSRSIDPSESVLLLEIPSDVNRLRAERPELAACWGAAVRDAFVAAFSLGFRAESFGIEATADGRRCSYVLRR